MVHRESIPVLTLGAEPSTLENVITRAGTKTNQNSIPERPSFDSGKATPSIVQKANAVLNDELNSQTGRNAEEMGKTLQGVPPGPETTIEECHQQVTKLGITLVDALENRMEQPAQIASQLASIEELPIEDEHFPNLSSLKFPFPVSPGKTGRIPFTLINDDPKETADFTLYSMDLVGMSGHRIPEAQITVHPNSGMIKPGDKVDGYIEIRVPTGTPQGSYGGLLQTEDINQLQAMVQLSVKDQGSGTDCDERGL